nr:uncharacterized protein LOC113693216 [Coffea arabica]
MVAQDVYRAVLSFFCGAELSRFIMATSIVLLPKVMNPKDFTQFHPISVYNFLNKVISRILVGQLSRVDVGYGEEVQEGDSGSQLDMAKAYDRVSWRFLSAVLRRFGFGKRFIDMVWRLISNVWFSVLVNGAPFGFFKSSRGLCQGDPLSPALFIIGSEKNGYLVHPRTTLARKGVIERVTKFQKQDFPVRYLGAPLFIGRAKEAYFSDLCQKVLDKQVGEVSSILGGWRSCVLGGICMMVIATSGMIIGLGTGPSILEWRYGGCLVSQRSDEWGMGHMEASRNSAF